ncbi:MAG TPA: ATP-binding protein, partial [Pedobacter sp.]
DKDQMFSSSMYSYHSEASSNAIREVIMPQLLATGKWKGALELIHQQTGEIIPIHKQLFVIREDITNEPIAIAGIARDLRPEIKAGKALDFKNTQLHIAIKELEFLANSVPVVVWTSTPDGKLDYINQRWYERGAVPIRKVLGNGWGELLHPDDEKRASKTWKDCLRTGKPYQIEFRLMDKYGDYRWWLVRAIALKDDNGYIMKWYGSNVDISDHKELERQKDNFLGVASHELKTPVTSIKAYAQVLEMMFRREGDTKNAEMLAKMDNQINRLNNLIGDLLEVTKINTGRLQFNHVPFNFNEMVEEVTEDVQRTALKHEIQKQLHFNREIIGDRERICQVITNLLTNAIKYSPDADRIIIYTEDHGNEVQLCVQDFGIGIRKDQQDRVFEQFYRVSGTREHTFPGLGLGLYISSEIVKHLNGRIWVDSTEGKGSTFCFAIPVVQ